MTMIRATAGVCLMLLSLACGEVTAPGPAEEFCADYAATCGFDNGFGGEPYASNEDCLARYEGFGAIQRECVIEHLAFAASGEAELNCPRAAAAEPCDRETTFCRQYDLTCGFGNGFGGEPYLDDADCQNRFDALSPERQTCVLQHLDFARQGDEDLHCTHVEGAPPCD